MVLLSSRPVVYTCTRNSAGGYFEHLQSPSLSLVFTNCPSFPRSILGMEPHLLFSRWASLSHPAPAPSAPRFPIIATQSAAKGKRGTAFFHRNAVQVRETSLQLFWYVMSSLLGLHRYTLF